MEVTRLRNALLTDGYRVDVELARGLVTAIWPVGSMRTPDPTDMAGSGAAESSPGERDSGELDLSGYLLLEALVEPHAHLDKVFTVDRVANPDGTLSGAMAGYEQVMLDSTTADIQTRARRALRVLVANGVTAVRTHVGCGRLLGLRGIEALAAVREELAPYLDLQVVAHVGGPAAGTPWGEHVQILRDAMAAGADIVGGNPWIEQDADAAMEACFGVAVDGGWPVDLHIDETTNPAVITLRHLARLAAQTELLVTASHAVSLGSIGRPELDDVAAEVAAAGVAVVTLPATNLYLQGRASHPQVRGLTALDALERAGVTLAAGGDNTRDPYNPMGRLDPLETASLLVTAGHRSIDRAWAMVTPTARAVMGLQAAGPQVGRTADLLAIRATNLGEALALASADRLVLRRGQLVSRTTTHRSGPLHEASPSDPTEEQSR